MAKIVRVKYVCDESRCVVCHSLGVDLHHLKTRKAGGGDEPENIMPLCRKHHTEVHTVGLLKFADMVGYGSVRKWLVKNGWEIIEAPKRKWIRYDEN